MSNTGEVIIERSGKQYGATYTVNNGKLHLKTHTETRTIELGTRDAEEIARDALTEIVEGQTAD